MDFQKFCNGFLEALNVTTYGSVNFKTGNFKESTNGGKAYE